MANDVIQLDRLCELNGGSIYLSICPGKKQGSNKSRIEGWQRDLVTDLIDMSRFNIRILVCLLENHELQTLQVADLNNVAAHFEMQVDFFPIVDHQLPTSMVALHQLCQRIYQHQYAGRTVSIFCSAGRGRTGTVAACYLVYCRYSAHEAIQIVHEVRKHTCRHAHQQNFVHQFSQYLDLSTHKI